MFAITGITGHVGGATAEALLERGAPVRAVVRDEAKAAPWVERGAEVAVADLADRDALAAALHGCDGAFVMLPTLPTGGDAEHRRMAEAIAAAVADSGVPHVVVLSSWGAELPDGTGPIRWLHHLENGLRASGVTVSALRACHFQEKVEEVLGAALGEGIYPVFGDSADRATPMVATRDIGVVAARRLIDPPATHEVTTLEGPAATERDVADLLAVELGRPIEVVTIPREGWADALVGSGLPGPLAEEVAALYDADLRGLLQPHGDGHVIGPTSLRDTIRRVLATTVPAA